MFAEGLLFRLWIFGSLLYDGVYCHASAGCRASRLDDARSSLRRAIITGELSMPSLVEVVSNIVGVWPLIVVYLKETGRKTDGDSLVVYYFLDVLIHLQFLSHLHLVVFFRRREVMAIFTLIRWQQANSACFI